MPGSALTGGSKLLKIGLKQLSLALPGQLLADGGHVERSPAVQLAVLARPGGYPRRPSCRGA